MEGKYSGKTGTRNNKFERAEGMNKEMELMNDGYMGMTVIVCRGTGTWRKRRGQIA
jgi:hypothetical protein